MSAIAYGNGRFVAVGSSTDPYPSSTVFISTDGKVRTRHTLPYYLGRIAYREGKFVTAAGKSVGISTDGVSWTFHSACIDTYLEDISVAGDKFVTFNPSDMAGSFPTSEDGMQWTRHPQPISAGDPYPVAKSIIAAAYGTGKWIMLSKTVGSAFTSP